MMCINCGASISDDANFCRKCGRKIEKIPKQPGKKQMGLKKWALIGGITATVVIAVTVGVLILFYQSRTPISHFKNHLDDILANNNQSASELEVAILDKVSYKVISYNENSVELLISAPDMWAIIGTDSASLLFEEDADKLIAKRLSEEGCEMKTTTIFVELDGNGNPKDTYALMDAMYGNLFSVMKQTLSNALEDIEQ